MLFSVIFFSTGMLLFAFGQELGALLISIAFFGVLNLYFKQENYKRIKDSHIRFIKKKIHEFETYGEFEFKNDCLRYSNEYYCTWVNWHHFKTFKIKKSNLILIDKRDKENIFMIGESEVNPKEFQKILNFVKLKIPK